MIATLTAYYNRDPQQLVVDKPVGEWMAFEAFLKALGFRQALRAYRPVPGRFVFKTENREEMGKVFGIATAGGEYLTSGNLESTFQV